MARPVDEGSFDVEDSLIEDFGVHIGRAMGWPPMAGRAGAVLMLSETPMTLAELQEALDASKGSVSETTRLLMDNGTVERFKPTGSRQFVFRWRDDAWIGCLRHQLHANTQLLTLAENGYSRADNLPDIQRRRLRQMRDYYRYIAHELGTLLAEYTRQWEADKPPPSDA